MRRKKKAAALWATASLLGVIDGFVDGLGRDLEDRGLSGLRS